MCVPTENAGAKVTRGMTPDPSRGRALSYLTALMDRPAPAGSRNMSSIFDPEGDAYDYTTATASGMGPSGFEAGGNVGHWGSVTEATDVERSAYGLPAGSHMLLKGAAHPTFPLAVRGENERGSDVVKRGPRYWSVPRQTSGGIR